MQLTKNETKKLMKNENYQITFFTQAIITKLKVFFVIFPCLTNKNLKFLLQNNLIYLRTVINFTYDLNKLPNFHLISSGEIITKCNYFFVK